MLFTYFDSNYFPEDEQLSFVAGVWPFFLCDFRDKGMMCCVAVLTAFYIFMISDLSMSTVVIIPDAHADGINAVFYGDVGTVPADVPLQILDSFLTIFLTHFSSPGQVNDRRAFREIDYQPVGVFAGHRDGITYINACGDDRYLLSNSKDQTIKMRDLCRFSNEETMRKIVNCVQQQSWDYRWQPAPPSTLTLLKAPTDALEISSATILPLQKEELETWRVLPHWSF